ncbi:tetratricopeptide repeat protein [Anaerolinea thermophila]|uniref:tetratricopeptide repeat protein n=2 Tax=Anaerolinea TaxID=233189 RepID=UPI00263264B8|nr:tetratricopeptide repeat protein [Anaerolinea thermophila]
MAGNQAVFQQAMNQGHSAAWDQDWVKAAQFYAQALEEMPDSPLALSSLGLAYFELGELERALECYQRASKIAPTDPVPYEKLTRIYERMGKIKEASEVCLQAAELHLRARDVDKAIEDWVHVLSLYPEHLPTRQRLAAVYERMGRKMEAINEYIAIASIFQRTGDMPRALKSVEYALRLMPESQEARFALHMLRTNQLLPPPSRPKGSTGPIRMASVRSEEKGKGERKAEGAGLNPVEEGRQKALEQLASLLFDQVEETQREAAPRSGLAALARGVTGPLSMAGDRTRMALHIGQAIDSQMQGDVTNAIAELERAADAGLRHAALYYDLGYLLADRDGDKALRYLQEAAKHPEYLLPASLLRGKILLDKGMLPEAAAAYLQALAQADVALVPEAHQEALRQSYEPLIDAVASEEDLKSLETLCLQVRDQLLRPDWRDLLTKARENLPQSAPDAAPSPVAEILLETRGGQVVEAIARVRELSQMGLSRTAQEEAFYALQLAPHYLPLHEQIGELLLQEGRREDASRKFQVVAELYAVRGEVARAARLYRRVLQMNPMDLAVREQLIELLVTQERIDEALEEYMELADAYYRLAELDKARQTYLNALKIAQQSRQNRTWGVEILLKVADIDMQRLNFRQALRIYEQIRTIQPDNPQTRLQLVQLNLRMGQASAALGEVDSFINLMESTGRRAQAVQFLQDLIAEAGANVDLYRRLADLYVREGRIEEGVAQMDAAANLYLDEGKVMEAINLLETIVSLNPPNVQDYREALNTLRRDSLRR